MPGQMEWTAREWFEEAERVYVERHQACPWCGGSHQVYRGRRASRMEYYCPACDFFAFYDESSGQFYAAAGHDGAAPAYTELASRSQTTTV